MEIIIRGFRSELEWKKIKEGKERTVYNMKLKELFFRPIKIIHFTISKLITEK